HLAGARRRPRAAGHGAVLSDHRLGLSRRRPAEPGRLLRRHRDGRDAVAPDPDAHRRREAGDARGRRAHAALARAHGGLHGGGAHAPAWRAAAGPRARRGAVNEADWRLLDADRPVEVLRIDGWLVRPGDRVLLRPQGRGDVFDLVLDGKVAVVESIEQDLEGNFKLSVVLEEDPGAYLGLLRQPGHRFFFSPGEVAPLPPDAGPAPVVTPTVLVA